jgi:hypothetical protein
MSTGDCKTLNSECTVGGGPAGAALGAIGSMAKAERIGYVVPDAALSALVATVFLEAPPAA